MLQITLPRQMLGSPGGRAMQGPGGMQGPPSQAGLRELTKGTKKKTTKKTKKKKKGRKQKGSATEGSWTDPYSIAALVCAAGVGIVAWRRVFS